MTSRALSGRLAQATSRRNLIGAAERLQRLQIIGRARLGPRRHRALAQAQARIGDDQAGVDRQLRAEPAADRAGAVGVVEREQPRLDLGDGEAGDRAGEFGGEEDSFGASGELRGEWRVASGESKRPRSPFAIRHFAHSPFALRRSRRSPDPSASSSAVSKLSASRLARSGRTTSRSTTTSMSCFTFLSSVGASAIS